MEVRLTAEQEAFIRQAVESGRYASAEEAVRDGIARLEEEARERAELRAALAEGEADLAAGEYTEYTEETLRGLADELIHEARAWRDSGHR